MRGNLYVSILLGILAASLLGLTTDQILQNVYDSTHTALRANIVTGGSAGTVTSTGTAGHVAVLDSATNITNYAGAACATPGLVKSIGVDGSVACNTPVPTATAVATPTPRATDTPAPTATPQPTPTAAAAGNTKPFMSWSANQVTLPSSAFPTYSVDNNHPVLAYDPDTNNCGFVQGVLPAAYAGGGLTVDITWAGDTATTGNVVWQTAFERLNANNTNINSDSFGTANSATSGVNGTLRKLTVASIAHSNSEISSLAAGDGFRLEVCRTANSGSDTMTGAAHLVVVDVKEP